LRLCCCRFSCFVSVYFVLWQQVVAYFFRFDVVLFFVLCFLLWFVGFGFGFGFCFLKGRKGWQSSRAVVIVVMGRRLLGLPLPTTLRLGRPQMQASLLFGCYKTAPAHGGSVRLRLSQNLWQLLFFRNDQTDQYDVYNSLNYEVGHS